MRGRISRGAIRIKVTGLFLVFLAAWALWGCACVNTGNQAPVPSGAGKTLFVVSHGWHTGIVVPRKFIIPGVWPENQDFSQFEFLEVGWGDEGFYRAKKITTGTALKAVFWPTSSVLHIVGFDGPVKTYFSASDIVKIRISDTNFNDLCGFIGRAYSRDEKGRATRLGPGLYGNSKFYRARGKYYFPKTCNVWTAQALKAAGCPINPACSTRAKSVIDQAKEFGAKMQPPL